VENGTRINAETEDVHRETVTSYKSTPSRREGDGGREFYHSLRKVASTSSPTEMNGVSGM
ncbi:MAG: hypothetical protein D6726_09490, partial [Nitrospirae bacterium]